MLYRSNDNNRVFEVAVYNESVRKLVEVNMSHSYLSDYWANPHIQDIKAQDEAEAEKIARDKFPSCEGFVVEQVSASRYFQMPIMEGA
jgi:hypothetical protein